MISPTPGTVSLSRHRAFRSPHREAARQGVRPLCHSYPHRVRFLFKRLSLFQFSI